MPAHETHTSAAESGDAVASSSSSGAQQVDAVLGQTINGATASNGAVAGAEKRTFQVAEAGGMEDEDEGEGDDNETEVEGDEDEEEEDDDEDDELSDAPEKKQDATAGKVGKVEEDEDKDELEPEGEEHESIDYTTLWLKEKLRFDLAINGKAECQTLLHRAERKKRKLQEEIDFILDAIAERRSTRYHMAAQRDGLTPAQVAKAEQDEMKKRRRANEGETSTIPAGLASAAEVKSDTGIPATSAASNQSRRNSSSPQPPSLLSVTARPRDSPTDLTAPLRSSESTAVTAPSSRNGAIALSSSTSAIAAGNRKRPREDSGEEHPSAAGSSAIPRTSTAPETKPPAKRTHVAES